MLDISARKGTAKSRTFLLWFIATMLIAIAMATCPAFAFADDDQAVPEGVLTLEATQDEVAAIPEGAITFDVETSEDNSVGAADASSEAVADQAIDKTVEADAELAEETELAKNQTTEGTVEANAELAEETELAKNQTTVDNAEQIIAEEPDSTDYAGGYEQIVEPASNDDAIEEPSVIDAAPNAPPAINENASIVDNSNVASNDNQVDNNAQDADGTAVASSDVLVTANNVIETAAVALPATVNMYFHETYETTQIASKTTFGPDDDFIYTPAGGFLTVSGTPYPFPFSGSNIPTERYKRLCGYEMTGWYVVSSTSTKQSIQYVDVSEINTKVKTALAKSSVIRVDLYAKWNDPWQTNVNYKDIDGDENESGDGLPQQKSIDVNTKVPIPATDTSVFAGWFLWNDVDEYTDDNNKKYYKTKADGSSTPLPGNQTLWQIIKQKYNLTTSSPYSDTYHSSLQINDTLKVLIVAAYGDTDTNISYTVKYTNTDGSGNATSESVSQTHGTAATQTAVAEPASSTPWTTPSEAGYDFTFGGWNTEPNGSGTTVAAAKSDAVGGSLTGVWGTGTPANGQTYTLYAVWTKTAQTYTVTYNSSGWKDSISEKNLEIPSAGTPTVKDPEAVWGEKRSGYQFDGWYKTADYSGSKVDLGTTYAAAFTLAKGQTYTLYAKWTKLEYTIKFDYDGATTAPSTTQFTNQTGATSLSAATPAADVPVYGTNLKKTGYVFGGWSEGDTKVANVDNSIVPVSTLASAAAGSTHNLKAIWTEVSYTINWYAKWTTPTTSPQPVSGATATSGPYTYTAATSTNLATLGSAAGMNSLKEDVETTETGNKKVKYSWVDWYITVAGTEWKTASGSTAVGSTMTLAQAIAASGATVNVDETSATGTITIFGVWTSSDGYSISFLDVAGPGTGSGVKTSDTVYKNDDYHVTYYPVDAKGYTFTGWKDNDNNTYVFDRDAKTFSPGTIDKVTKSYQLTAQWVPNKVKFNLYPDTEDSTVSLNGQPDPTATVGETVKESDLTTATPTRDGYDFAGWSKTSGGTVIIGPTETYTVVPDDAPSDGTVIDLYAKWKPWTYTVKYYKNGDAVVYQMLIQGDFDSKGGTITADPYVWTAKTDASHMGLASPDIILIRDYYQDKQYVKWVAKKSDGTFTAEIDNGQTLGTIYGLTGNTNRIIELYAVWNPITYTVNYTTLKNGTRGTVTTTSETINLATGKKTDGTEIVGSTASVTDSGYDFDVPTWTNVSGTVLADPDNPVSSSNKQATYKPSIKYLRYLYDQVPSSTEYTFYANFTEASFAYKIQAFMQNADGSWNSEWASPNDLQWTQIGTTPLTAKLNSTINYDDSISGTTATSVNGKKLYELALVAETKDGASYVSNDKLYVFDSSHHQSVASINISSNPANNVIKLYYKRRTYELAAEFVTKSKPTSTAVAGAPSSVTTAPGDYVNGGSPTTAVRWGDAVELTLPTAAGYDFAWAVTRPSVSTSALVQPTGSASGSLVLSASDMDQLVSDVSTKAKLTGTFTGIIYTIKLEDYDANSESNWDSSTAGTALKTSRTASTTVSTIDTLASWLPNTIDNGSSSNTYVYYLAGWKDTDNPSVVIAPDALRSMKNWTKDKTFTAVWMKKVVITYDPGAKDSFEQSKAAWTSKSHSFNNLGDPSSHVLATTIISESTGKTASFKDLVGLVDSNDNPLGADGWEFDYWVVDGDSQNYRYGQTAKIPTTEHGNLDERFLDGTTSSNGILLNYSWKFIAVWKPKAQTVLFENQGKVVNNTENTGTVTTVLQNVNSSGVPTNKTYGTDDVVNLSDYEPDPADIPAGYELAGWRWVFKDSDGAETSGTYALGTTFHVKNGTSTTLNPYFNEKTVTFTYEIAPTSTSRGTISPTASDTVYAVTHNGINAHTATTSNADAYSFVSWTYNSGEITTDNVIDKDKMIAKNNIVAGKVLEGDRTYYANFSTIQYKLTFAGTGTDGTNDMGTVTADGTPANVDNSFTVDWNTRIPTGGTVTVDVPIGYELDGWIESDDGSRTPQSFSGPNSNLQGVYNYVVTRNITLTAHFKVSSNKDFTVYYDYDPSKVSHFTSSEGSKSVTWADSVLPSTTVSQPGYTFEGWYIDKEYTEFVVSVGDEFGKIYTKLGTLGKTKPNYDPDTKSITIYGKWKPESFEVAYDLYGKVDGVIDSKPSAFGDITPSDNYPTRNDVGWDDLASGFKVASGPDTFERPGYTLSGWYATYTAGGVTTETSSNVQNGDTYGKLAGNLASNKIITLHAIWTSRPYIVEYIYDDGEMKGTGNPTPSKQVTKGWGEQVDYYTTGAAPAYAGYKFNGYTVTYVVTQPTAGTVTGTPLTAPGNTTIRDMVDGNTSSTGSTPIVRLKATWTKESSYVFQDRLIHQGGTWVDKDVTSPAKVDGNTTVVFADKYGAPKTTYDGYDFDYHKATNPKWSTATATEMTVTAGQSMTYYVYYLERTYTINYYEDAPASASAPANYTTSDSPWESAAAKLPTVTVPARPGYTFDGWYLTTTTSPDDGVKLTGSNSIKATGVYTSAPAKGTALTAVAKWIEDTVTIEWNAAANGTTNPDPGTVSYKATETPATTLAIEAVPDAGGDYVFEKWTYEYVDPSTGSTMTGDVTATSKFASLSGTESNILTPTKWAMNTGDAAVWHDIKFTAHFALGSALKVTINYHYEDANETSTVVSVKYPIKSTVTKRDAVDGADYILTPEGVLDGYTLNEGLTKAQDSLVTISGGKIIKKYDFNDAATQVFDLYFDANEHTVTYKYVLTDGTTEQTITGADPLTNFNNGTFKTGQKHLVSNAPTLTDYEFNGWFLSTNYNGTDISGTEIVIGVDTLPTDANVLIVGTWTLKNWHVSFSNGNSAPTGTFVTQKGSGYTVKGGSKVKTATPKAAGVTGDAADLKTDLEVDYGGTGYAVTGWNILIGGVKQGEVSGELGPLNYEVHSDVVFQPIWSKTYAVSYSRGAHGNFTDTTNSNITVVYDSLNNNDPLPKYTTKGSVDSNSKPDAVDGWEWVGWGVNNSGTWTYYFADELDGGSSIIDYNGTTGTHVTTGLPTNVNNNIDFVGFYKALVRQLVFSTHEYDSGVPDGTESTKTFADEPQPTLATDVASTYDVRTGQNATMLSTTQLERAGFTLTGWTDGSKTYTPGSTNEFVMPDGPVSQIVYLYPVFNFTQIVINYAVHSDSTGLGDVDEDKETFNTPTFTVTGSNPVPAAGYEFDYWTIDGDDTTHLTAAEGLQSDNKLVPVDPAGTLTFYVHFKAKKYDITISKNLKPGIGEEETLPTPATATDDTYTFADKTWTNEITLGTPTRPGYDFTGWDVYDTDEWTPYASDPQNTAKPTALRTGIAAGTPKVSALGKTDGSVVKLTLIPTWSAKSYKVIFNDGKASGTGTVAGMPATNPRNCEFSSDDIDATNPTRDGYTFGGWANSVNSTKNVAAGVTTLKYSDLVDSESDTEVTLTAIWNANDHTIKYVKDTEDTWSGDTSKYPAGDPIFTGTLTDPTAAIDTETDAVVNLRTGDSITRTGSKLLGWKHGTVEYLFATTTTFTMPDADVELTPIWEESGDYNVYFQPGATDVLNMPADRTNIPYSTSNIDMSAPSRPGWTFDGWSSSVTAVPNPEAGKDKKYSDLVNNNDSIKKVTLTATWTEAEDYQVTFDKAATEYVTDMPLDRNDLKWSDQVYTLYLGTKVPGRAGYIFEGWTIRDSNKDALGNTDTTFFTAGSALFSELAQNNDLPERKHLTLVANWSPKTFTVEFDDNKPTGAAGTVSGMPATNPVTGLKFDTPLVTVPALALAGYEFKGWTNSATGEVIQKGDYKYSVLSNNNDNLPKVTLTAKWEANPHTITYTIGSGDNWSTNDADYPASEPSTNRAANPSAAISTKTDATIDLRGVKTATRPGSTLKGWKDTGATGTEKSEYLFENGDVTYKVPDRDVTLAPIWEEDEDYNVYFLPGDDTGATKVIMSTMPADQTYIKYSATGISTLAPTRPGYIFAGWANDSGTALGDSVTSADYANLVNHDFTDKTVNLTAKWTKDTNYKVSYKDGVPSGATTPFTGTLPVDVPSLGFDDDVHQTELNISGTDRVGFTFDGWKVTNDADGSTITKVTSGYADALYSAIVSGNADIRAITFTAMWSGTPYKLTYHKEDGTWVTSNIADEGQATPDAALTRKTEQNVDLRLADTMKRDGYTLVGWANGKNKLATGYVEYKFVSTTNFGMPAMDVDLYPLWDAKTYTITYVEKPASDTGSIAVDSSSMPTPNPQTGEYNGTFTYGAPTRQGYDFGGWDVFKSDEYDTDPTTASLLRHVGEGSGTYASLASSADIDALTMVAIWTPMKLGVTYILDIADKATWVKANIKDSGKDSPNSLISYETDQTVNLREANTVSRDGYVLIGWKEDNSPTVTTAKYPFDADGHASFTMPATNVLLYAVWQIKDGYTVVFDGNAPTTDIAPGAVLVNMPDDQPIAPAKLTWEGSTSFVDTHSPSFLGYNFKGWDVYGTDNVKINSTPIVGPGYYFNTLALTDTPEHEHLTLKAIWEIARDYNVYFKDGVIAGDTPVTTGTMPSDQTGITYVTVVDYHAPSRIGYTFDGWDVNDITVATDVKALPAISASDAGSNPYYVLAGNNSARKSLELIARWIEKTGYNVHFVGKPANDTGVTPVNMGSLTDYIDIAWDDTVIAYPAPTRTGYDFQHWAVTDTTDPDNTVSIGTATAGQYTYSKLARDRSDDTIMDITLTAIWKVHEWKVTYVNASTVGTGTWMKANITDAGKNTPDSPVVYAVDTTINLRDATTLIMSGYKLVGWQEGETAPVNTYRFTSVTSFIMPDRDVDLYPIWEPKEYKVFFDENKPAEATDPSQIVTGMPVTQWEPSDAQYPMTWNGDVDTKHPVLVGYEFAGWIIENASETGALTGVLEGTTYTFSSLALTDTVEHETIKLIAQWRPATYRVNYVDGFDSNGTALATPVVIKTDDTKLWIDTVSNDDPWTVVTPAYTGKSNDDWQFNGWMVLNANTNTYVALSTIADQIYSTLAAYENLTVADVATANETPALVLYASWTRRVPFIVDFMKRDGMGNDTLEDSTEFVGLDGQIIDTTIVDELSSTWKDCVLNTVGPDHKIPGYEYSMTLSAPYVTGTLSATAPTTLHVQLIYTQLTDYTIIYDATPGALVADPTKHTGSKGNLTWESAGSTFPPTDSDWFYVGHKIDGWTYGPTGVEYSFGPTVTFEEIAKAIYGTVDGSEGRDVDGNGTIAKPVTIFAKWVERTDYKVKYDDNYAVNDDVVKSNITDSRFLDRVADATYTPATKDDVAWSASDIEPTDTDDIVKPGVKGGKELYEIEGWNYLSKDGYQKPAEGLSFAEIFDDMYDTSDPASDSIRTITLYARYKEIAIKITYTPVLSDDEGNIISMGASAAGTVSRSVESPDAVTGIIYGSTATPNRGYHFIGWRRLSDNETIYTADYAALAAMASGKLGFNVLPNDLGGATLLLAAQNSNDGYWHDEEYLALFAQNETAILHYDKNAEDATGYIADVEAPYETLIDLSDGSGYTRKYWTLVSWNTEPDGTGTTYALGETGWEMPQGETTLYAQWVKNKATLTYYPGGDDVTGIPDGITDEWGTEHSISTQTPKRDHYTFVGWNTKEDGTGTWYYGGEGIELPGDGLPLYAQWKINKYTASVDPGPYTGGDVTYINGGTYTIEHGGYLPSGYVTAEPRDGYRVTGWKYTMTDEYGNVTTGVVDDPTKLQIIGDVVFEAVFEEIPEEPTRDAMSEGTNRNGDGADVPKTGDDQILVIYASVAFLAMIILILAARRRREEEEE